MRWFPSVSLIRLHFARILMLDDLTLDDITAYGLPRVELSHLPGVLRRLRRACGRRFWPNLVQRAGDGLKRIFSHCDGFTPDADLLEWMKARNVSPATDLCELDWTDSAAGRRRSCTARCAGELRRSRMPRPWRQCRRRRSTTRYKQYVRSEQQAGRLTLTPPQSTPLGWWIGNLIHLLGVPLLLLLLAPFLLIYLAHSSSFSFAGMSAPIRRSRRASIPLMRTSWRSLEDHDVTNQFSAMGQHQARPVSPLDCLRFCCG